PAGKERAAIGERQRDAEVEADQRVRWHFVEQPGEDFGARPAVAWSDYRRCAGRLANRYGDALVPLARCTRPVDRREVPKALAHFFLRGRAGFFAAQISNERSITWRTRSGSSLE